MTNAMMGECGDGGRGGSCEDWGEQWNGGWAILLRLKISRFLRQFGW